MIAFSHVSFSYPNSPAPILQDCSFQIEKGELVVLSAATGSGKSSILKLLTAEEQTVSGIVTVGEFELSRMRRSTIALYRRTIGCVFGDFQLLEEKTVFENIAFALEVQSKIRRPKIGALVDAVLDRLGISSIADQFPKTLSLGERQRTAIARALVTEPIVLIADDPTSLLDAETAKDILAIFSNEYRRGMTIFIATSSAIPLIGLPKQTKYLSLLGGRVEEMVV